MCGRFKEHLTAELGQIRDRGLDKFGKVGKGLGAIP